MRIRTSIAAAALCAVGAWGIALAVPAYGQSPAGAPSGVHPAYHLAANQGHDSNRQANRIGFEVSDYMTAYGDPVVVPASYCGPGGYYGSGCGNCGGGGCPCCKAGPGPYPNGAPMSVMSAQPPGGWAGEYSPYGPDCCGCEQECGGGGCLGGCCLLGGGPMRPVDQCGPHYFDFSAEAIYMKRDKIFNRQIDFSSLNIDGPIVLSSTDLDTHFEPGFRLMGRYDLGALSFLEFGYWGIFDFAERAEFVDPNPISPTEGNIFSLWSEFGTNPAGGVGMPATEQAVRHRIAWDSDLQNAEISFRRYWVGFNPRVSGTFLVGFRYTRLNENFIFGTEEGENYLYHTQADNDLAGLQLGGDAWVCVRQGCRIGAEGKAGIYNNQYKLRTNAAADGNNPPIIDEEFDGNNVAFIGEARVSMVADILPSLSLKAGYEVLWLNSVVTAGDNFNTASPYQLPGQATRVPFVDDQEDAFFHGASAGLEYVW